MVVVSSLGTKTCVVVLLTIGRLVVLVEVTCVVVGAEVDAEVGADLVVA